MAEPNYKPVDPKQSFPELEERVLERWRERDVFRRSLEQRAEAPIWSFYEGPPTANGKPGAHHVLSRVFKDVYPRYRTMRGYRVPRKAGWDCHGLPVELEVEKEIGIGSKEEIERYGVAEFNQRCRESVFRYVEDWNRLTERIGFWLDLEDPYVTLTNEYIESVWWSLKQLWERSLLYEGHKVVPYCPRCGTALSSHEVALGYRDVEDPSIYVRFPLQGAEGESLLVWTTTPWTLPGNVAVAVAPGVTYVRARFEGEILILAEPLVERVLGEGAEIVERFPGKNLVGRMYEGPVFALDDREPGGFPVIAGEFVTTEDGTGLVHIAPAFGDDDYAAAAAGGIFDPSQPGTLYNPVKLDGSFDARVAGFAGRLVTDPELAGELIGDLDKRGLLWREEAYAHPYPHCWRCDSRLIYYAKASWYVRTSEFRERMLELNETIGWHPEHIKHGRFGKWLEGNVDWALSRDRYWGTPLPIWRCVTTPGCKGQACVGSIAELAELGGASPDDLHRPFIDDVKLKCPDCGGEMQRVEAVIDTWYDSGAMPFAQLHYPFENEELFAELFPADFICEAIDQTRGWFYTLLATSTLLFDATSYRNCVCLGLILDPEGQKMSKSQGNVVEPAEVIDRHGADALRWYYLTAQQPWAGYRFSVETVGESVRQFLLTLWNTYSFWALYANADGYDHASAVPPPPSERPELDRWALSRLQATAAEAIERLDGFDSTAAGRAIAAHVDELSNWYVRLTRRRFWAGDPAALATLRECLLGVAKLLAPFVPFFAEEIYANLAGGAAGEFGDGPDSVHLCDYPEPDTEHADPDLELGMEAVRRTVELGRTARAAGKLKLRQPLRRAVAVASDQERAAIESLRELVLAELNVKELDFVADRSELDGMASAGGYEIAAEAEHAVALATELDEELLLEGLARAIVRAVQNARKQAGLEITDRIELRLAGDGELLAAARAHEEYVAGETLANSVSYGEPDGDEAVKIDGRELAIGVSRSA